MLKSVAVVAVINQAEIRQLFEKIVPTFSPDFMLTVLPEEFSHLASNELNSRLIEFLKFIYLRSLWIDVHDGFVPVKKPIDEIWHAFIVQTREYARFCQALPGKVFLHHTTVHLEDFAQHKDRASLVKEMLAWIPRYREHFGLFTPEAAAYWMMPGFLQETLKMSLAEVNQL